MFQIKKLINEEKEKLEEVFKTNPSPSARKRAHAILLNNMGFTVMQLTIIFMVYRQTILKWLHSWEKHGISSVFDKPKSGRPPIIPIEKQNQVIEEVKKTPRSLKYVLIQLLEKIGIKISVSTLKRLCKKLGFCWKRVRKSLKSKQDPELFEKSKQELIEFIKQAEEKQIDLVYFDQAGFTLTPCIPYAWQAVGATIEIPCFHSKRLNVLGFMNRNCVFQSMVFESSITSSIVVECINLFSKSMTTPTVLVMDNASIHTSNEFTKNIDIWKQQGLIIYNIAPYSPELNLIEILWRKIKYEWLPFSSYNSFDDLRNNLFEILANIGKSYAINFS